MISLGSVLNPQQQNSTEQNPQGKGWIVSLLMHILFIVALFLPMIVTKTPEPEPEGLLVNLGLIDQGEGEETPKGETEEISPEPSETQEVQPVKQVETRTPAKQVSQKVVTSNEESAVIAKEAEAKKAAQAESQRKATAEAQQQEAYNKTKKSYGDLLGGGGKGNTGKPGSQGDPNGDPNSNVLEGISNGSGRVGGGLGNRGVLHEPQINDRSQKTGRVVITVCVDKNGKVIKADYTQKGSTTTDSELKDIARKAALQFKFTLSEIEEQCGTITVDFKVRG
jgi:outer membrane biosynthesis protein TonB